MAAGGDAGAAAAAAGTGTAPQSYTLDVRRYFATPETETDDFAQCMAQSATFSSEPPKDAAVLLERFRASEDLIVRLRRHTAYWKIAAARDIDNRSAAQKGRAASQAIGKVSDAMRAALLALGDDGFARAADEQPALRKYAYLAQMARRDKAHDLPVAQQAILDDIADPAASAFWSIYQQTLRTTPYATLSTNHGLQDVGKNAATLALDPDRGIRQAAWQQRWQGLAARADIYASTLLGVVRLGDTSARLSGFPDAPAAVYFDRHVDRAMVDKALKQVAAHADLQKRYQHLRAARIAHFSGITEIHSWDLQLAPPGLRTPTMTLDQTRAVALAALAPLGTDYVAHFRALLDPANGRMDIASDSGKRVNDGFSVAASGVPSGLFIEKYALGSIGESRVVIHEGGHAIHAQMMNEAGVSQFYLSGPKWMNETYSAMNEMLLYEYLASHSPDPLVRAFYLEAGLSNLMFQIFGSAQEATLEQSIYDGVIAGTISKANDLDALTADIWGRYEIWPAIDPELRHSWITRRLMFEDPLYLVNYLYSGLIAAKMFDMLEADPFDFQQRYATLLRAGFSDAPDVLLKSFFGRDLDQRELVDAGISVLSKKVDELEALYRQLDTAGK